MSETIFYLIMLIIAMIVHEIGHLIPILIYTKKFPKIKINLFGFFLIFDNDDITPLQEILILMSGIYLGAIVILFTNNLFLIEIYAFMCLLDISILVTLFSLPKRWLKIKFGRFKTIIVDER